MYARIKIILMFLLIILGGYFYFSPNTHKLLTIIINNDAITVDEAITLDQQQRGLAGRTHLAENKGMLFIYSHEQPLSFWMKGMLIPIDMIWLDKNYRIVYFLTYLFPCVANKICSVYTSPLNAQYVLETAAGFCVRHHLMLGQQIQIKE